MADLIIEGGGRLSGLVVAPPDKSIFHRALILAAMGEGICRISPLSDGADNRSTIFALQQLGVRIDVDEKLRIVDVHGVGGPAGLKGPSEPIDCGNSGTTMRLLAGLLSASPHRITLTGDDSLKGRPMSRLLPLAKMGAQISGEVRGGKIYPPLVIRGGRLRGQWHDLTIASAQVKSALLLAGLWASGTTTVVEPNRSRDHTERMLTNLGVEVIEDKKTGALSLGSLAEPWRCKSLKVAPDLSSAAFLIAAAVVTDSEDVIIETGINPTRAGFVDAIKKMGVVLETLDVSEVDGEPVAKLRVGAGSQLMGTTIDGELTLRSIDEIPLLASLAAFASGKTTIRDASELRVKESDRLSATRKMLEAFGASVTEMDDGLQIEGGPLHPARVPDLADHRMAMAAAVVGLGVLGVTQVAGREHIDVSFPQFASELGRLGAKVRT